MNDNLLWLYMINDNVLKVNSEGVTHDESLIHSEHGGNCINWVIGHVLISRMHLLKFLDVEWKLPEIIVPLYNRGTSGDGYDQFMQLEKLKELWGESQKLLTETIGALTPEQLGETAPTFGDFTKPDTRERRILFLHFHESYHLGQLGLMRRLLGKQGAIQ